MDRQTFRKLVEEALVDLPPVFAQKLDNVEIVVEDEPSLGTRIKMKLPPWSTLLGLYEGVPATKRGSGYTMALPDKITIYQKPIEHVSHTPEEIKTTVRRTVLHEIGHHFGLDEAALKDTKRNF